MLRVVQASCERLSVEKSFIFLKGDHLVFSTFVVHWQSLTKVELKKSPTSKAPDIISSFLSQFDKCASIFNHSISKKASIYKI